MAENLWEQRYTTGDTPWDSGTPSVELARVLREHELAPTSAIELGCGTGTNAVWLAQQGFTVTALDLSATAIERARLRAQQAGVELRLLQADLQDPRSLEGKLVPADLVFDRGTYHVLRRDSLASYLQVLELVTKPGSHYIVLAGNANEPDNDAPGPPRVAAHELCGELDPLFRLLALREFSWSGVQIPGRQTQPLGWSAILRRR